MKFLQYLVFSSLFLSTTQLLADVAPAGRAGPSAPSAGAPSVPGSFGSSGTDLNGVFDNADDQSDSIFGPFIEFLVGYEWHKNDAKDQLVVYSCGVDGGADTKADYVAGGAVANAKALKLGTKRSDAKLLSDSSLSDLKTDLGSAIINGGKSKWSNGATVGFEIGYRLRLADLGPVSLFYKAGVSFNYRFDGTAAKFEGYNTAAAAKLVEDKKAKALHNNYFKLGTEKVSAGDRPERETAVKAKERGLLRTKAKEGFSGIYSATVNLKRPYTIGLSLLNVGVANKYFVFSVGGGVFVDRISGTIEFGGQSIDVKKLLPGFMIGTAAQAGMSLGAVSVLGGLKIQFEKAKTFDLVKNSTDKEGYLNINKLSDVQTKADGAGAANAGTFKYGPRSAAIVENRAKDNSAAVVIPTGLKNHRWKAEASIGFAY